MTDARIVPVLLAGGSGTRLWPMSREAMPKQFMPMVGDRSTYQQALLRLDAPGLFSESLVVTVADFRFFARRQAEEINKAVKVVLEPERRDSAAAIAAGAALARQADPDAIVLALAADHVILDPELFRATCVAARKTAAAGHIVTFGIRPTEPRTSYGYIRRGEQIGEGVFRVERFVEKPDAATAAKYVADGYSWNSGNFMFRADVLLSELERHQPQIAAAAVGAVEEARDDLGFVRLDAERYARAPRLSIDYAVMEKTDRAVLVEGAFRWSDIGSWDAIFDISARDGANNAIAGEVVTVDSENCLIQSQDRLVAALGVKDLIIVTTPDAVLVLPRSRAEEVKGLVARLQAEGKPQAAQHRRGHRPWGYYDSIDLGERFQVKRLVVIPGGTLSLQKHLHRSEHWVVVRGTAEVTVGDQTRLVHENESAYIPLGAVHRLANPGKIPAEIIEVQTGSYFGEDDIIRFEDVYRRNAAE